MNDLSAGAGLREAEILSTLRMHSLLKADFYNERSNPWVV